MLVIYSDHFTQILSASPTTQNVEILISNHLYIPTCTYSLLFVLRVCYGFNMIYLKANLENMSY